MENTTELTRQLIEAAKSYSCVKTNDNIVLKNPKIYTAFREGQDSAIKLISQQSKLLKEDNERLIAALKTIAFDSTCLPYKVAKEALQTIS